MSLARVETLFRQLAALFDLWRIIAFIRSVNPDSLKHAGDPICRRHNTKRRCRMTRRLPADARNADPIERIGSRGTTRKAAVSAPTRLK